ncbi:MAG: hypothetical protein AB1657_05345 [Candidatus Micrarchaeota archaeon]
MRKPCKVKTMKITMKLSAEEAKKIGIIRARYGLPSDELAVRRIIELHSINPGTR